MPQLDLVTYLYICQFLYICFWVYFAVSTLATNVVFELQSMIAFNRFSLVLPLISLFAIGYF